MKHFLVFLVMMFGLGSAVAQEAEAPEGEAWQVVITGQIEAFRAGDGEGALDFAGLGFKAQFTDPQAFYEAILAAGYEPIVRSRSHSFGNFNRVGENLVLQIVRFVGPDQGLYEAIYQMLEEPDGWRVQGVILRREEGVGI